MSEVTDAINEVISALNAEPYLVHTESDIRCLLYSALLKRFIKKHEISRKNKIGGIYTTTRVHTEYPAGNKGRIDTVILNEHDIINADYRDWLAVRLNSGYRPILIDDAIEIKKCLAGEINDTNLKDSVSKDVDRLVTLKKTKKTLRNGHIIFFCRWETGNDRNKQRMRDFVKWAAEKCSKSNLQFYHNDFEAIFL